MAPSVAEHELLVRRLREPRGARVDLAGERLLRGAGERLGFRARGRCVGREHEAVEPADGVAFDHDFTGLADVGFERGVLAQPAHQHAGAAVDEALGEPLVQRVGELVLDRARDALPVLGIGEPVGTVGGEGPGADMGDAVRQRIDVAFGMVGVLDLAGEPVGRDFAFPHQKAVERDDELGVGGRRDLAIVGDLADFPQPLDRFARLRHLAHVVVARGVLEHQDVLGDRRARQAVLLRHFRQRSLQRAERKEIEYRYCATAGA